MIKNKEELITESNKWGLLAIDEVKTLVENLMESNDMEVEELADFLGWKPKKVQACLDGEGDLRISDLATLLIANDLVLEIKPASQTDISYGEPEEEEDDEDKRPWDDDEEEEEEEEEAEKKVAPIKEQIKVLFGSLNDEAAASLENFLKEALNIFKQK